MTTLDIARKDFLDVRRAKMVWFVCGVYGLILTAMFYWGRNPSFTEASQYEEALGGIAFFGALLIPLVALVAAYLAIAGERESGSVKYLLSVAGNRRDVLFGKFLSRTAVVMGAVVAGFAWGIVLALIWYDPPEMADVELFVGVLALTLLYVAVFCAVAVGISAMTTSRSQAMGGAIGFYMVTVVFSLVGFGVANLFDWVFNSQLGLGISDNVISLLASVTAPTIAFLESLSLVFPETNPEVDTGDTVWYLEGEMMIVVLLAWIVVPLAIGYWRFERADIG